VNDAPHFAPKGPPDRELLEALAGRGATLVEIAAALDRSIATVRYWLRKWDIPRPDCRRSDIDPATAPILADRACPKHGLVSFRLDPRGTYRAASSAGRSRSLSVAAVSSSSSWTKLGAAASVAAIGAMWARFSSITSTQPRRGSDWRSRVSREASAPPGRRRASACCVRQLPRRGRGGGSTAGRGSPGWIRTTKN
jgi:hypothetical protein